MGICTVLNITKDTQLLVMVIFFSPAYRRTLETEVSVTDDDDDGPYSLSYPSNCLVCQNIIVWYTRTFILDVKGGPD